MKTYEITIGSRLEELEAVSDLVSSVCRDSNLNDELTYWLELTVMECMINAIRHGNRLDPSKKASLRILADPTAIEIIVEDDGDGFQVDALPNPTEHENLLKPSGRGLLFIRSFMDKVMVTPRDGGGTQLRMVKNLEHCESQPAQLE
jgi:serine/threonine-protein kinase RsbW